MNSRRDSSVSWAYQQSYRVDAIIHSVISDDRMMGYLHHSHHVGFGRLSRMLKGLFGLSISEGAIANSFRRMKTAFDTARAVIKAKLLTAPVIA